MPFLQKHAMLFHLLQNIDKLGFGFAKPTGNRHGILMNLISKIKNYPKVLDEQNSLTYLPDFLVAATALIAKRKTGIYNIVNPGPVSPYDIMMEYKKKVDPNHEFERLTVGQMHEVAKAARSNCVLSGKKLEKEGIIMRPSDRAIAEAFEELKKA